MSGPVAIPAPRGVRQIPVHSALEMRSAVFGEIGAADIFIGVAAVADYRPANAANTRSRSPATDAHQRRQPGHPRGSCGARKRVRSA